MTKFVLSTKPNLRMSAVGSWSLSRSPEIKNRARIGDSGNYMKCYDLVIGKSLLQHTHFNSQIRAVTLPWSYLAMVVYGHQ